MSKDVKVLKNIGLRFENVLQNRIIYFNDTENDFNQLRVFPQVSSKISYPLSKNDNKKSQILEPILMPIIAPYNNYNNDQSVSNSNIFSLNRETSFSQWESGPRLNYGVNWLINYNHLAVNTTAGQSLKLNKNREESNNEKSDYFITNIVDFKSFGYIKTDLTIDNDSMYLKENNINTSINIKNIRFGFDYDYESNNRIKTSEQISIGMKTNLLKDTNLIASIRKDLMSEKSIGNAMGIHYENDCLAINLDYFRDFTAVADIKNSRGFSFTITLKPFGTSKQRGKTRNFGPKL
jgi:LPS-assembly protein